MRRRHLAVSYTHLDVYKRQAQQGLRLLRPGRGSHIPVMGLLSQQQVPHSAPHRVCLLYTSHHLTNWGTCSLFCIVGEKKTAPYFTADGSYEMRETLDLGLTIDERLADGYYYSKSIKLLKYLLEHPELLERPANEEVDYDHH